MKFWDDYKTKWLETCTFFYHFNYTKWEMQIWSKIRSWTCYGLVPIFQMDIALLIIQFYLGNANLCYNVFQDLFNEFKIIWFLHCLCQNLKCPKVECNLGVLGMFLIICKHFHFHHDNNSNLIMSWIWL